MAGVAGYWLDRSIFPYARPHTLSEFIATDDLESLESLKLDSAGNPTPIYGEFDTRANIVFGLAMLRRAIIVGCAMLALGLGA